MAGVNIHVDLSGFFFTGNPVGRLHRNIYTVLKEEGEFAVRAARAQLYQQHGYASGTLSRNVTAVPMRRRRSTSQLVVSANYGREMQVRKWNRWVDQANTAHMVFGRPAAWHRRGIRFYARGAKEVQAHIDGRISSIERTLTEGLT